MVTLYFSVGGDGTKFSSMWRRNSQKVRTLLAVLHKRDARPSEEPLDGKGGTVCCLIKIQLPYSHVPMATNLKSPVRSWVKPQQSREFKVELQRPRLNRSKISGRFSARVRTRGRRAASNTWLKSLLIFNVCADFFWLRTFHAPNINTFPHLSIYHESKVPINVSCTEPESSCKIKRIRGGGVAGGEVQACALISGIRVGVSFWLLFRSQNISTECTEMV